MSSEAKNIIDGIKKIQLSIASLFRKIKFFEVSNGDMTLLFDASTIKVGDVVNAKDKDGNVMPAPDNEYTIALPTGAIKILVEGGVIKSIVNAETGESLNEYTFKEVQPTEQKKEAKQSEQKSVEQGKKEMSVFQKYMKEKYINDVSMADYPWDQCISDMQEQGVDCPECVCAAIKNRTVAHHIAQGLTLEKAIQQTIKDVQSNETLKYILKKNNDATQPAPVQQSAHVKENEKIKQLENEVKNLNEVIKQNAVALRDVTELIAKMNSTKNNQTQKNTSKSLDSKEIEEFRKKYFN